MTTLYNKDGTSVFICGLWARNDDRDRRNYEIYQIIKVLEKRIEEK